MPLQTIQLTLLQQVQLVIAIEEQVKDLKRRVSNPGADPSTSAFLVQRPRRRRRGRPVGHGRLHLVR